ncbi:MAG: phosphoenolpyruvate synthase regulatory protein [Bacteroidetes bacterium]|nr:phosphoenolpyruvate synthase regulatory protein [Bacteroidota bacterium]
MELQKTVIVASDGTGRTAQQALDAALTQFPDFQINPIIKSGIRTKIDAEKVVQEAIKHDAFILHTIVTDELRNELIRLGREHNIDTIDLMGPLLRRLKYQFSNIAPVQKPGLYHNLNKEYFRRIDSIQFAFKHDDGLRVNELNKAEIVFLGVSRTFKTPLSIYFAYKGWFVANVPIILGMDPPKEIFNIDPKKVFCLTTSAQRLSTLRKFREDHLGFRSGDYAQIKHVRDEILFAESIYKRQPNWNIIKVTSKSVEEIASEILAIHKHTL